MENKKLKEKATELQQELSNSSFKNSENLGEDLNSIKASADQREIPHLLRSFFWEEQQKYIKCSSRGIRYHPRIIQFCLSYYKLPVKFWK